MLSIDEINELKLLKGNYEAVVRQNIELQQENKILKHKLNSERWRNTKLLNMLNERKEDENQSDDRDKNE